MDALLLASITYSNLFKDYPDVVSVEQVSEMLGVSTKTVYGLMKRKRMHYFKVGKVYKIPKLSVLEYMGLVKPSDASIIAGSE